MLTNEPPHAYWVCQGLGWMLYAAGVAVPYVLRGEPVGPLAAYSVTLALLGWVQTHVLRAYANRHDWGQLEVRQLAPRVLVSSALMGIVMDAFMILASVYYLDLTNFTWASMTLSLLALSWLWWFFPVFVGWQALYFAVQFVKRAHDAERKKWQLQSQAQAAELRFLEAQLNPHFLFNALNGLRGLIGEDPERAQMMVTRLSGLLRHSLHVAQSGTVTLARELEIVDDHLSIEAVRLEERLRVIQDIDPICLRARVPPMLLQGLVENGIKHGIARAPGGGVLSIRARLAGTNLHLSVTNTGNVSGCAPAGDGLGLRNAAERLRRLYADGATIELEQDRGEATTRVVIPGAA